MPTGVDGREQICPKSLRRLRGLATLSLLGHGAHPVRPTSRAFVSAVGQIDEMTNVGDPRRRHGAFPNDPESQKRPISLFLRISGQKTASHFSLKCSGSLGRH